MTTVTVSNLTADKITVILPSGETITASSDGVSVSTAPEVKDVVALPKAAAPAAAPADVAVAPSAVLVQ